MHSEDKCSDPKDKNENFFQGRPAEKMKRGTNNLVPKKRKNFGDRNFWPMEWPGVPKFGGVKIFYPIIISLKNLLFK